MSGDYLIVMIILVGFFAIIPVTLGIWSLAGFIKERIESRDKLVKLELDIQKSKEREAQANLKAIERQYGLPSINSED